MKGLEHVKALIIKFIMVTAILWFILGGFYGVDFGEIITISVILTPIAYIVGDLLILRYFNNMIATIADFGLSFLTIWFIGLAVINEPISIVGASLISALAIGVGEWFYHYYVNNQVFKGEDVDKNTTLSDNSFATEFAEETDIEPQDFEHDNDRL